MITIWIWKAYFKNFQFFLNSGIRNIWAINNKLNYFKDKIFQDHDMSKKYTHKIYRVPCAYINTF